MSKANRSRRRRIRLWMRLMQRIVAFGAYGGTRRGERWWTKDWDRLSQLDPALAAQRLRWIEEQET